MLLFLLLRCCHGCCCSCPHLCPCPFFAAAAAVAAAVVPIVVALSWYLYFIGRCVDICVEFKLRRRRVAGYFVSRRVGAVQNSREIARETEVDRARVADTKILKQQQQQQPVQLLSLESKQIQILYICILYV